MKQLSFSFKDNNTLLGPENQPLVIIIFLLSIHSLFYVSEGFFLPNFPSPVLVHLFVYPSKYLELLDLKKN